MAVTASVEFSLEIRWPFLDLREGQGVPAKENESLCKGQDEKGAPWRLHSKEL